MKKRKLTKKELELKAQFDKLMAAHSKPLERGAKAKGAVVKTAPVSKRGTPLLEAGRLNTQASLDTGASSTAPKENIRYTGDKVLGIALMHKSTFAPVFDTKSAEEIARMRR